MNEPNLRISCSEDRIEMGKNVIVRAWIENYAETEPGILLLPYVNGKRWGAHERYQDNSEAVFLLPLPNPGSVEIEVVAVPYSSANWMGSSDDRLLLVGSLIPEWGDHSNRLTIQVERREIPIHIPGQTIFGVQWEPWFISGIRSWRTAHAVPVLGFYESYNRDVIRQHILWFMDLGIDFIFPDWTNHIWGCQHWDERPDGVNAIVHATTLTLEVLAEMKEEGLPVPKVVLFPGLSNGPPATMEALNEELAWIYHTYVRNPRFEGLWLEYEGKPLIAILDTGAVGDPRGTAASAFKIPFFKQTLSLSESELDQFRAEQPAVNNEFFTVRWMSSQNDTTWHHELGYWSWMDGSIEPAVTYIDGVAEAVTVSIGFFGARGWLGEGGYGRRGGATLVDTFKTAFSVRPVVVFLHQFNEFAGQPDGHGYGPERDIYVDSYSVEYSDDFEPVSLTAPGYRGDKCGWGFFYLNLVRALMDIYHGKGGESTVLVISNPLKDQVAQGNNLHIAWSTAGKPPSGYSVFLDGELVFKNLSSCHIDLPINNLLSGEHKFRVYAEGVSTRYPLSEVHLDEVIDTPIEVYSEVRFVI